MLGMFLINANNKNDVLFVFKNSTKQTYEKRIKDLDDIKKFNPYIIKRLKEEVKEHYDKPYKLYYVNIAEYVDLIRIIKKFNLKKENLNNPLIQTSELEMNIYKILNTKYDKYDIY